MALFLGNLPATSLAEPPPSRPLPSKPAAVKSPPAKAAGTSSAPSNNPSNHKKTKTKAAQSAETYSYYRTAFQELEAGAPLPATRPPSPDPLLEKVLKWAALVKGIDGSRFDDVADFLKAHPEWPAQNQLQRRAEFFLLTEPSDARAVEWFDARPPQSRAARQRYIDGLEALGRTADVQTWVRRSWVEDWFAPPEAQAFLTRHASLLRPEEHRTRADRALARDDNATARRLVTDLAPADQAIVSARLSIRAGEDPAALLARLDQSAATDPGVLLDSIRALRRAGNDETARNLLMLKISVSQYPDQWWTERDLHVRRLLREKDADTAYRIASGHGLPPGTPEFAEAEFLSGLIALYWQKLPETALVHFQTLLDHSRTPTSQSRGAFWAARAVLALNRPDATREWLRRAAAYPAAFYGQLAAALLEAAPQGRLPSEPIQTPADKHRFDSLELTRIARKLAEIGLPEQADPFLLRLGEGQIEQAEGAAQLAAQLGRAETAVLIARRLYRTGRLLPESGYPLLPDPLLLASPEPALVHAIIRQESNYAPGAISRSGARGLMQLMPATARQVAKRLGLPHSDRRLTAEPNYNLQLGRTYLATVLDQFNGNYALAIASYNAGPARIRQWLRDYGEPGQDLESWLIWIEQIPFAETRNYVQRVLEGVAIYRERLGQTSPQPHLDATVLATWCLRECGILPDRLP